MNNTDSVMIITTNKYTALLVSITLNYYEINAAEIKTFDDTGMIIAWDTTLELVRTCLLPNEFILFIEHVKN